MKRKKVDNLIELTHTKKAPCHTFATGRISLQLYANSIIKSQSVLFYGFFFFGNPYRIIAKTGKKKDQIIIIMRILVPEQGVFVILKHVKAWLIQLPSADPEQR